MSTILQAYRLPSGKSIEIALGNLTKERVDAIVNAANSNLAHGGGIAAAIVAAGGEVIQQESTEWVRRHGRVTNREPAYTNAGKLPCRYVIHAVGPIWGEGEEDRKMEEAVRGSLERAEALGLESLALPAISTGIFGFPRDRAARVILEALRGYLSQAQPSSSLRLVRLVLWDDDSARIFTEESNRQFGQTAS